MCNVEHGKILQLCGFNTHCYQDNVNMKSESESEVAQSCPTLCDLMDCSLPGSSVQGIFQARVLEWITISFSRGSSQARDQTSISCVSCIGRWILYHCATWETKGERGERDKVGVWD